MSGLVKSVKKIFGGGSKKSSPAAALQPRAPIIPAVDPATQAYQQYVSQGGTQYDPNATMPQPPQPQVPSGALGTEPDLSANTGAPDSPDRKMGLYDRQKRRRGLGRRDPILTGGAGIE